MKIEKQLIDLKGKKFGKLLVLELDHKKRVNYQNGRSRTTYFWKCKCDCGNIVVRSGNSLREGYIVSCGCHKLAQRNLTNAKKKALNIKVDTRKKDLTGQTFGKLLVLSLDHIREYTYPNGKKKKCRYWKCACECGNEVIRAGESLKRKATLSCGCLKEYKQMMNIEKKKYLKEINMENDKELES